MERVAIYVRVSTDEQKKHGLSVDSQLEALETYCKENKYEIAGIYNDAGYSASKSYKTRPALNRMIKACQDGDVDLILFTKLDRFFRNVPDYYAVMERIGSVPWRAIWEDYETQTSSGKFKVNIMLSVAQSEADRTSERIKSVFEYKRSIGEVLSGQTAIGYVIKDKRWVKDESQREAVEEFFKNYLATFKFQQSYDLAKIKGLKASYRSALSFINNECYYGKPSYVSEAYITKEQYDLIQKNREHYPKNNKYDYIFRGVCKCGMCGAIMAGKVTPYTKQDGSLTRNASYMCSRHSHHYDCIGATINELWLEAYLLDTLDKELGKYNMQIVSAKNSENKASISQLRGRLTRIKNLYELGDMSFEEYKQKRTLFTEELSKLEAMPYAKVKEIPSNWKEVYQELDIPHKNAFWISIIEHIEVNEKQSKNPIIFF